MKLYLVIETEELNIGRNISTKSYRDYESAKVAFDKSLKDCCDSSELDYEGVVAEDSEYRDEEGIYKLTESTLSFYGDVVVKDGYELEDYSVALVQINVEGE